MNKKPKKSFEEEMKEIDLKLKLYRVAILLMLMLVIAFTWRFIKDNF